MQPEPMDADHARREVLEGREALAAKDREIERLARDRDAAIVALGEWERKAGALETRVAKLEEALEEVVEECVRVAEEWQVYFKHSDERASGEIAAAIRALKGEQP